MYITKDYLNAISVWMSHGDNLNKCYEYFREFYLELNLGTFPHL